MQVASREDRIVVTTDQDFEEMIWREGKPPILRLENLPREKRKKLLEDMLNHSNQANGHVGTASISRLSR